MNQPVGKQQTVRSDFHNPDGGKPETLTADPQAWGPALSCATKELKLQEHKTKKLNE